MTVFETLNSVNVNGHTEQKNGLTYLSWAWAWAELLKKYPEATYTVYENRDGWNYHTDGRTAWVKTGVTVDGKEYIEMLPVMDFRNRSIPLESITSMDVNKAIQRSLTKAVARHGLGLYIYAGEDLPEEEKKVETVPASEPLPPWEPIKAIEMYCKRQHLKSESFKAMRKALVAGGVVPEIPFADLTKDQLEQLCNAIEANYPDALGRTA